MARFETVKAEVEAFEVTDKYEVVALVEVAFNITRFVMVEVALLTITPSPAAKGWRYIP